MCVFNLCEFWNILLGCLVGIVPAYLFWLNERKQAVKREKEHLNQLKKTDALERCREFYYKPMLDAFKSSQEKDKLDDSMPIFANLGEDELKEFNNKIKNCTDLGHLNFLIQKHNSVLNFLRYKGVPWVDLRGYSIEIDELRERANALHEHNVLKSFYYRELVELRNSILLHLRQLDYNSFHDKHKVEDVIEHAENTLDNIIKESGYKDRNSFQEWMEKNRRLRYKEGEYSED